MNFKLQSLKVKEDDDGNKGIEVTVTTQAGLSIKTTLKEKDLPAFDTLEVDVSREVKQELRKELKQLELRDESTGS
jgi:hypothetical protein